MTYLKAFLRSPRLWQTLVAIAAYLVSGEIQDVDLTVTGLAGWTFVAHVASDRILDALVALGLREVSE